MLVLQDTLFLFLSCKLSWIGDVVEMILVPESPSVISLAVEEQGGVFLPHR